MKTKTTLTALLALVVTSCNNDFDEPTPAPPFDLSRSEANIMTAQNDISLGLLAQFEANTNGNFAFSPYSIQQAISMIGNGVSTQDLPIYMKVFGGESLETMNGLNRQLNSQMPVRDPAKVEIRIANSLWQNSAYDFNPEFAAILGQYYDAEVQSLDFAKEDIAGIVNKWVNEKTNKKIPQIYPEGQSGKNSICFIANAFYFKGQWQEEFKKSDTKPAPFYDTEGNEVSTVDMMAFYNRYVLHYGGKNYNMIRLPYGNGAYEMAVILPNPGVDISEVLNAVEKDALDKAFSESKKESLNVKMPRFSINSTSEYTDNLEKVGVPLSSVGYANLCPSISFFDIYHGVDIVVDEKGTTIAAATVGSAGDIFYEPQSSDFIVDHEFIFIVRECSSGSFLALGIVRDPAL